MNRVQYINVASPPVVGQPALVIPFDHPTASNKSWIRTTRVQAVTEGLNGPIFRTLNTIYRPMDGIEPLPVGKVSFRDYTKNPFINPEAAYV